MTLDVIRDDALDGVAHGFFTRKGGASSGVFAGLNCGLGSADQREIVQINRDRVLQAMQATSLVGVHQVHSADVVTVDAPPKTAPKADALVTATPGLALAVLTADCQPVLFADRKAGVIGAAHAGWKGAMDGVLDATIDAMETLGAQRAQITAVIGPSISQPNYEVGPEFLDRFLAHDPDSARFFAAGQGDRVHFDLPGYGLWRLRAAGVGLATWTRHCTYADPDSFYSYRRSVHAKEADYGRLIACIRL